MKNLHENALIQEMSLKETQNVNGGIVPLIAAVYAAVGSQGLIAATIAATAAVVGAVNYVSENE